MKISHIGILFGLIGLGAAMPTFAASSICGAVSDNLILNCGFETGDFTDWTVTPAATSPDLEVTLNIPNSGTHDARFGAGGGENDLLDQTFATTEGDSYTVSFYVDSGAGVSATGQFIANWDGSNILTLTGANGTGTGPDTAGYEFYTFTETASSGSSDLEFGGNTKNAYYHLDDVVVTQNATSAVPEPSSISFAVMGLFGVLLVGRRYMEKRAQQ
jgi:hypothetical protein